MSVCRAEKGQSESVPDGFLFAHANSKVCIELLDTFRVTPESLALAEGGSVLRSRTAFDADSRQMQAAPRVA